MLDRVNHKSQKLLWLQLIANKNRICYKTPGFALVKILPVVSCIRKYNPQELKHVDLGLNARIRLTVSHLELSTSINSTQVLTGNEFIII